MDRIPFNIDIKNTIHGGYEYIIGWPLMRAVSTIFFHEVSLS